MKLSTSHTLRSFETRSGGDVLSFMSLSSEDIKNQQLMKPGFCEQSRGVVGRLLVWEVEDQYGRQRVCSVAYSNPGPCAGTLELTPEKIMAKAFHSCLALSCYQLTLDPAPCPLPSL